MSRTRRGTHPIPHLCPVCHGRGTVPQGFYAHVEVSPLPVMCQSCGGHGYIVLPAASGQPEAGR